MTGDQSLQFAGYLQEAGHLRAAGAVDPALADRSADGGFGDLAFGAQRKIWELTDLSGGEFADEAARFYKLARVTLQEMLQAAPLVSSFSARFLRETLVFPYRLADGGTVLSRHWP